MVFTVLAVSLAVACGALIAWRADESLLLLLRDPVPAFGGEPYVGALSLLGTLVWSGGAVVAAFSGAVARRIADPASCLLITFAALTAVLALDDLLLLHEQALPDLVGVSERFVFAVYAVAMVAILVAFQRRIRQSEWPLLVLALALFGAMTLVDLEDPSFEAGAILEDVFKLLGIAMWTLYLTRTGWAAVMRGLDGDTSDSTEDEQEQRARRAGGRLAASPSGPRANPE